MHKHKACVCVCVSLCVCETKRETEKSECEGGRSTNTQRSLCGRRGRLRPETTDADWMYGRRARGLVVGFGF